MYANHLSFLGIMWKYARQCKESQACRWLWERPDARLSGGATVNQKHTQKKGRDGRQTDDIKEWKKGEYVVRRNGKREELWNKHIGGRQVPGGGAGNQGGGGGRSGRKRKETPAACLSLTRCPPVSTDWGLRQLLITHHFNFLPHFNRLTYTFCTCHTHSPSLPLSLAVSLPPSHSLVAIFTSKPLHYLPSLRAIRNGVTLSCRHGRSFITTHPLSQGPLWGLPTLMERILGASAQLPQPSTWPPVAPPFDW